MANMSPDPAAQDSPRLQRLAQWAGLAPKVGVGVWAATWGMGFVLPLKTWECVVLGGWAALAVGAVVGVVGGVWVLRCGRSDRVLRRGKAGALWGGIALAGIMALGGCAWWMGWMVSQRAVNYDRLSARNLAWAVDGRLRDHPETKVDGDDMLARAEIARHNLISWHNPRTDEEAGRVTFRTGDFILVPGIQSPPRPGAVAVFVDPAIPYYRDLGKVPMAFEDGNADMLPFADLEAKLKAQTGLGSAEIVRRQREENP